MSRENVEVVRALFEVWNAADMDAFRELYDPDVSVRTVEGWPEPGPYVGREGRDAFSRANSATPGTPTPW
jgi:ketosteroid isomerase-like protein